MRQSALFLQFGTAVIFLVLVVASPVSAAKRLQERSLYMSNDQAGAQSTYRISFKYMSPAPVGSVELLFCTDPIPYNPCVTPTGMSVAGANLSAQNGETGFAISSKSVNRIVISRIPQVPTDPMSAYTFTDITNPTNIDQAFAVRMRSFGSNDATGAMVDFGGLRGQVTEAIEISTQVPPMLVFCLAEQVDNNCTATNDIHYKDLGELSPTSTLRAQSQMAVGTNASAGFVITANGPSMSAGNSEIKPLDKPLPARTGTNQFGINLVANSSPNIGENPEGTWANAVATPDYGTPNLFKYISGDPIAMSPNVSLMKKFTVSYIVNTSPSLRAGIYTTTINFIASGRF